MAGFGDTRVAPPRGRGGPATTIAAPSRDPVERTVARLRRSARRLVIPSVLFIGFSGLAGYAWGRLPGPWLSTLAPVALGLIAVPLCLIPALSWVSRVSILTTRRVIVQSGFLTRTRREFVLVRGSQVTLRRTPIQLLSGSGDVIVRVDGAGSIVLPDVSRARLVHAALTDLLEHAADATGTHSPLPSAPRRR